MLEAMRLQVEHMDYFDGFLLSYHAGEDAQTSGRLTGACIPRRVLWFASRLLVSGVQREIREREGTI